MTALLARLSGLPDDYDHQPIVAELALEARFPELVEYIELFEIADRIFVATERRESQSSLARVDLRLIQSRVSQALRDPAQVVADTPGLGQAGYSTSEIR